MSNYVEIKNEYSKEESSYQITPFQDSFALFYNYIFNPENIINDGENELSNGLNAFKSPEHLSSKSESVLNFRATDKIYMEKRRVI